MQLFFVFFVFFFTSTRSSKVGDESDLLASLDVFAFGYSQHASQQWDCPQVSNRVKKAEESRIWRTVIPDAHIEEKALADDSKTFWKADVYEWIKVRMFGNSFTVAKGSFSRQYAILLNLRKPNPDGYGSSKSVKMLLSKSKYINKHALSEMLPQLEQAKNMVLEQMAVYQVYPSSPAMAPKAPGPIVNRRLRMPQATNYHPRVFKDAHFTTGDLVALMTLFAQSISKCPKEVGKHFNAIVRLFLPGFSVNPATVPKNPTGNSSKGIYLCRSYQYIPAGANFAFYFDGNRGKFMCIDKDAIVLDPPKGIVDGQQRTVMFLLSDADVEANSLKMHQTEDEIALQRGFCKLLEKTLVLSVPEEATDAEVQAYGVATIRSITARYE